MLPQDYFYTANPITKPVTKAEFYEFIKNKIFGLCHIDGGVYVFCVWLCAIIWQHETS